MVDCAIETQQLRVKQRDQLTHQQIQAIINTQASRETRLAYADEVIDNSESTLQLAPQIKKLHNLYLSISLT